MTLSSRMPNYDLQNAESYKVRTEHMSFSIAQSAILAQYFIIDFHSPPTYTPTFNMSGQRVVIEHFISYPTSHP